MREKRMKLSKLEDKMLSNQQLTKINGGKDGEKNPPVKVPPYTPLSSQNNGDGKPIGDDPFNPGPFTP